MVVVELPHAISAVEVIRAHTSAKPDQTAVILVDDVEREDGEVRWSYARLDTEARTIGAWLRARYPVGERVLLLYPSGLEFVAAFVGCLYAGMAAVPAPVPGRYRHEQLRVRGIANDADVAAILTDGASLAAVQEWARAEEIADVPVLATDCAALPDPGDWTPEQLTHDDLAMLQYTSGATGEPKGVMVSHGNLLHNVDSQRRAWGLTSQTRLGGWAPLYHDMGLLGQLLPALMLGGTSVLMRPAAFLKQPYHWLRMIDKYGINWSAAPNFAYELCCERVTDEQLAGLDLSRWWLAANGSEPINAATLDAFVKRFAPAGLPDDALCPCYGMAEATVFVSGHAHRKAVVTRADAGGLEQRRLVPAAAGADLVSCGMPRDLDVVIADPATGTALAPGAFGEIWLRGPSITTGYWRNDAATRRAFTAGGYLRTGDLGALFNGELYVTGRLAEILTVQGRNLYPQKIEQHLRTRHAELSTIGAAFTVPLDEIGSGEVLVVTHEVKGRPAHERLRALTVEMKQTVAREYGTSVGGVVLLRRGGVRRTTSGKIQRATMRQLFLTGELNAMYADYEPRVADALRSISTASSC